MTRLPDIADPRRKPYPICIIHDDFRKSAEALLVAQSDDWAKKQTVF